MCLKNYDFNTHIQIFIVLRCSLDFWLQSDCAVIFKNKFWNHNVQFWYLYHPAFSNSLHKGTLGKTALVIYWDFLVR